MKKGNGTRISISSILKTVLLIAAAVAASALAKANLFSLVFVSGPSMQPALRSGDVIICLRVWDASTLKEGDIVVFEHDGLRLIKRVDRVLDGGERFWLLGDNRDNSNDSRYFGPVDAADIKYRKAGAVIPMWLFLAAVTSIFGTLGCLLYLSLKKKNKDSQPDSVESTLECHYYSK